jgi:hypothetical protein
MEIIPSHEPAPENKPENISLPHHLQATCTEHLIVGNQQMPVEYTDSEPVTRLMTEGIPSGDLDTVGSLRYTVVSNLSLITC